MHIARNRQAGQSLETKQKHIPLGAVLTGQGEGTHRSPSNLTDMGGGTTHDDDMQHKGTWIDHIKDEVVVCPSDGGLLQCPGLGDIPLLLRPKHHVDHLRTKQGVLHPGAFVQHGASVNRHTQSILIGLLTRVDVI